MAEVYPSLWSVSPGAGEPKDAAQVRTVARYFAELDREGALAELFAGDPDLTREQRGRVETEEAWTLGVTARAQRPIVMPAVAPHPPAGGEYNENRAFSPQRATAMEKNISRFQRLASQIRYLADQWKINGIFSPINEFCAR